MYSLESNVRTANSEMALKRRLVEVHLSLIAQTAIQSEAV